MDRPEPHYLDAANRAEVARTLEKILALSLDFKTRDRVGRHSDVARLLEKYVVAVPENGCSIPDLISFVDGLLQESINWSSPMFMGFNDAGNSVAGLIGGLIEATCQQNLINSDFCARAATFVEIGTIRWLRELAGYPNPPSPSGVADLGGVATTGGTCSNMYGLLMARKNAYPRFAREGLPPGARPRIFIAADITHYSVAAAVGLVGLGTDNLVKVPTKNFRFDLEALEGALLASRAAGEDAVCVVANAGDSRTLMLDDLPRLIALVRRLAPNCWIHVDACNGGQLIFSRRHRGRLSGIELADSIALDPHKVFNIPYTLSCFLFRDPKQLDGFWTSSTLIMRDPWALGQLTPNIGSKSWSALKLYLLLKHLGREKLGDLIDSRLEIAATLRAMMKCDARFLLATAESDVNAVPFLYVGALDPLTADPALLYRINERLYADMLKDGEFYVHGFGIKDDGDCLRRGRDQKLFLLRFMSGQAELGENELRRLLDGLSRLGENAVSACVAENKV